MVFKNKSLAEKFKHMEIDRQLEKEDHASQDNIFPESKANMFTKFGQQDIIKEFHEKFSGESSWINAGFFVFEPDVFRYLNDGDKTVLEKKPLESLATEKKLSAFKHTGFWHPMDTLRDKNHLENLWNTKKAPWKIW